MSFYLSRSRPSLPQAGKTNSWESHVGGNVGLRTGSPGHPTFAAPIILKQWNICRLDRIIFI